LKLLLTIIFFNILTIACSNQDEEKLFIQQLAKLDSHKYIQEYVGNKTDDYYIRYVKHLEEVQLFTNLVNNSIANNNKIINKWSEGSFHLMEKKKYDFTTYKNDYNVFFGNGSIIFKHANNFIYETVYIMTERPNSTFYCIDGTPILKYNKNIIYNYEQRRSRMVRIDELENESFYTFPFFDEKEPSVTLAIGYTSYTGRGGALYYIILSTISNKYHITELYDCGKIPPEIPHNVRR